MRPAPVPGASSPRASLPSQSTSPRAVSEGRLVPQEGCAVPESAADSCEKPAQAEQQATCSRPPLQLPARVWFGLRLTHKTHVSVELMGGDARGGRLFRTPAEPRAFTGRR